MSCFLTYSVNSVRISGDMPVQSDYVPTINIYFVFSIAFTMFCMMWFILCNQYMSNSKMPFFLLKLASYFDRNKVVPSMIDREDSKKDAKKDGNVVILVEESRHHESCNFCGRCESCKQASKEENDKQSKKKDFDRKVIIVNYIVLALSSVLMLICQLAIWISLD